MTAPEAAPLMMEFQGSSFFRMCANVQSKVAKQMPQAANWRRISTVYLRALADNIDYGLHHMSPIAMPIQPNYFLPRQNPAHWRNQKSDSSRGSSMLVGEDVQRNKNPMRLRTWPPSTGARSLSRTRPAMARRSRPEGACRAPPKKLKREPPMRPMENAPPPSSIKRQGLKELRQGKSRFRSVLHERMTNWGGSV